MHFCLICWKHCRITGINAATADCVAKLVAALCELACAAGFESPSDSPDFCVLRRGADAKRWSDGRQKWDCRPRPCPRFSVCRSWLSACGHGAEAAKGKRATGKPLAHAERHVSPESHLRAGEETFAGFGHSYYIHGLAGERMPLVCKASSSYNFGRGALYLATERACLYDRNTRPPLGTKR
jgi:hypothetical protein